MAALWTRRQALVNAAAICAGSAAGAHMCKASAQGGAQAGADPTLGRELVFEETFERLDPAIWHAGPKATTFDTGFYGRSAFSRITGEEGVNPYAIVDDAAASNGKALQISAHYIGRPMSVPNYYGNDLPEYQWVSGNIQTARPDGTILKGWRGGYFEARMWVPSHPLSFPAFWLMNGRSILYPKTSVELDVVEHKGWENRLYGTYLHEWGQPGEHHEGVGIGTAPDLTGGYFRYGMAVDGARIRTYFEREPAIDIATNTAVDWQMGRAQEMDQHGDVFWPLLTMALRSDVAFPQPLADEHRQTHLRIDYVRVYGSPA